MPLLEPPCTGVLCVESLRPKSFRFVKTSEDFLSEDLQTAVMQKAPKAKGKAKAKLQKDGAMETQKILRAATL